MFPDKSAGLFLDKSATLFPDNPVTPFPDKFAVLFLNKNVGTFLDKVAKTNAWTLIGAKSVIKDNLTKLVTMTLPPLRALLHLNSTALLVLGLITFNTGEIIRAKALLS